MLTSVFFNMPWLLAIVFPDPHHSHANDEVISIKGEALLGMGMLNPSPQTYHKTITKLREHMSFFVFQILWLIKKGVAVINQLYLLLNTIFWRHFKCAPI